MKMNMMIKNHLTAKMRPSLQGPFCSISKQGNKVQVWIVISLVIVMLLLGVGAAGYADEVRRLGFGVLTSIEPDRTVIIDQMGYSVDSSAQFVDSNGRRVRLKDLALPAEVKFEYVSGPKGPVINFLRVPGK